VNADLENGYADDPREAATILRDAAAAGIVGGSIEDWSGERIYDFNHAVERVAAGAEMARSLDVPFTFTARAENLIRGRQGSRRHHPAPAGLREGGRRRALRAGPARPLETMRMVASAVDEAAERGDERRRSRPDGGADREASGVKRISVGGALSRLALAAFMKARGRRQERPAAFCG
jgi:2-methylisocitrate lyase-like PEP mutase family enzyme